MSARTLFRHLPLLACLWGLVPPAAAGDFEDGVAAYQAGDFDRARRLWQGLAEQGEAAAQFNLGVLYAEGRGVPRDAKRAAALYRQAAEQGYPPAQFNLGVLYEAGDGVPRDVKAAARWWRKAADAGFIQAQYNLGTLYFYGRGVPQDLEAARRWFLAAAQQGDAAAEEALRTVDRRLALDRKGADATRPAGEPTGAAKKGADGEAGTDAAAAPAGGPPAQEDLLGPSLPAEEAVARESWIRLQAPDRYTIQLFANWTEASILTFIREHRLRPPLAYFRVARQGRPWYSLIQGVYPDAASAQAALKALPAPLRVMGAWVRSFGEVQKVMARGSVDGSRLPETAPAPRAAAGEGQAAGKGRARQKGVSPAGAERGALHDGAWLRAQDAGLYTLQVFADRKPATLRRFARRHRLPGPVAWFETTHLGRPWFALVAGLFENVAEARRALAALPPAVQQRRPWVRSLGRIHAIMVPAGGAGPSESKQGASPGGPPAAAPGTGDDGRRGGPSPQGEGGGTAAPEGMKAGARAGRGPAPARREARRALRAGQAAFNNGRYQRALAHWRPLAEQGLAEAQYNLGFLYESGWGVDPDEREAARWYRLAALQGHLRARFNLGLLMVEGRGVPRDTRAGIEQIRGAAEDGDVKAREFLARAYREGLHGLPRDPRTADYWRHKARQAQALSRP